MNKKTKLLFFLSIFINILIFWYLLIPKYWAFSNDGLYSDDSAFSIWWLVKWLNFKTPKTTEWYIIFWYKGYSDLSDKMLYYYVNFLWEKDWLINSNLKKLEVKSNSDKELVIWDSTYEFTISKNTWKVTWKDKNWQIFELWMKKYIWF
jgi:hypothetical protein